MENWVFISYRRDDSGPEARSIRDAVANEFGREGVFFDTDTRLGEAWPVEIQNALQHCTVVLAIIGPKWLSTDEWGLRGIDSESDWVRLELASSLAQKKRVLPIYVSEARRPPASVLPEVLRALVERQDIEIRRDFWDHDLRLVLAQLHEFRPQGESYSSKDEIGPYPVMKTVPPARIDEETLERILTKQLTSWTKVCSQLPEDPSQMRAELYKEFKFSGFREVIRFMREVAAGCEIADHHPRWENIYRTLRVYLTTWGIGHQVSDRDIQLARYFDEAYSRFARRSVPLKGRLPSELEH
jgi:pterin-4a-carbinolamine dehydratase